MEDQEICAFGTDEIQGDLPVKCKGKLIKREDVDGTTLRLIKLRSGSVTKKTIFCEWHYKKFTRDYAPNQRFCCNPFGDHKPDRTGLIKNKGKREITLEYRDKGKAINLSLIPGQKLCPNCCIKFWNDVKRVEIVPDMGVSSPGGPSAPSPSLLSSSQPSSGRTDQTPSSSVPSGPTSSPYVPLKGNFDLLNSWLALYGEEEIDPEKIRTNKNYTLEQLSKIKVILDRDTKEPLTGNVDSWHEKSLLFDEFIQQLKQRFDSCERMSERVYTLTVLPASLPIEKIKEIFGISSRLAKRAKLVLTEKGALASPGAKVGKVLDPQTEAMVKKFYYEQDVSIELTGKKNVLSVKGDDGKRTTKAKRLLLGNLSELHLEFEKRHPDNPISLSKFASLRPRECVLASSSGMHNVCVCVIHENAKLMFDEADLKSLLEIESITACVKLFTCFDPSADCYPRKCVACPNIMELREKLEVAFDAELVETVTFNQWESVDRCDIVTKTSSTDDFIDAFLDKMEALVTHHFIYKEQVAFFNKLKDDNQAIVIGDFAENYTFVVQDSVQGFYFGNRQATIHPFSVYFKDPESGESKQVCLAAISDYMNHTTTVAVYAFQRKLVEYLKNLIPDLQKIFYFSDGSSAQYKNKFNVANLFFHLKDFGISAEWHYFATSHGRSTCDSTGGTIKRLAYLYSLKHTDPGSHITTPKRLFEWVESNIHGIHCMWVASEEVATVEKFLDLRFRVARDMEEIKKCHALLPSHDDNTVIMKRYSAASDGEKHEVAIFEFNLEDVNGFVTIWREGQSSWEVAYVEEKLEESNSLKLRILSKAPGKKRDYRFGKDDLSLHPLSSVLTLIQPRILLKGTIVRVRSAEETAANAVLAKKLNS